MSKRLKIAVDFDGTICEHMFPQIGKPVPGAFNWMKKWQKAGAILILWTMRSDGQESGDVLQQAIDFCKENGVEFSSHNEGEDDREWTTSPKVHAHIYVDDAAFGCPVKPATETDRPMVNWRIVGPAVMKKLKALNA